MFHLSLFFFPLVDLVPRAATTAAQVMVGVFMMEPVTRIDFSDYQEALPAFSAIIVMPLAFSIADGIMAVPETATIFRRIFSGRGHVDSYPFTQNLWYYSVSYACCLQIKV